MVQLFFLLEYNLAILQGLLRSGGHSCFLSYDQEIGLEMTAEDPEIIARIFEQKESLGIDRIIVTRDARFSSHIGTTPVKEIILLDRVDKFIFDSMKLGVLVKEIIAKGKIMTARGKGRDIEYIECSKFYK